MCSINSILCTSTKPTVCGRARIGVTGPTLMVAICVDVWIRENLETKSLGTTAVEYSRLLSFTLLYGSSNIIIEPIYLGTVRKGKVHPGARESPSRSWDSNNYVSLNRGLLHKLAKHCRSMYHTSQSIYAT